MSDRLIIISGGDAKYFPLLRACLSSIRDKPEGRDVALGILDLGLTDEQRDWLRGIDATIVKPGWDIELHRAQPLAEHYKALTARPFLPRHFPGYDLYLWIDADAWVQDWSAVELFRRAAQDGALACVPEIDRSYRNFFHAWQEFHDVIHAGYREAFDEATATEMVRHPLINSGVFALQPQSPTWEVWAKLVGQGLSRSDNFLTEQNALNIAVYRHGVKKHFLPVTCNWAAHHSTPAWDVARSCFVEPCLPHNKIGILHLTVWTKDQPTADVVQVGGAESGRTRPMGLRYGDQR
ncbi:MAG: hypothetical protein ABI439_02480 [Rhodospirillales bacterium]